VLIARCRVDSRASGQRFTSPSSRRIARVVRRVSLVQRHFVLERQSEKTPAEFEDAREVRIRHSVIANVDKTDRLAGPADGACNREFRRGVGAGHGADIDHGNFSERNRSR